MPLDAPVITTTLLLRSRPMVTAIPGYGAGMRLQDVGPYRGHAPQQERPLGGYAILMGTFGLLTATFAGWFRRSGRELPERVAAGDVALVAVATHKASRLIAKDRVTSAVRAPFTTFQDDAGPGEVEEAARGRGLRRALGELLICPYCLGVWVAAAFAAGLLVAPRLTRQALLVLDAVFAADVLQVAYAKGEEAL
jgi:hypothetical protein